MTIAIWTSSVSSWTGRPCSIAAQSAARGRKTSVTFCWMLASILSALLALARPWTSAKNGSTRGHRVSSTSGRGHSFRTRRRSAKDREPRQCSRRYEAMCEGGDHTESSTNPLGSKPAPLPRRCSWAAESSDDGHVPLGLSESLSSDSDVPELELVPELSRCLVKRCDSRRLGDPWPCRPRALRRDSCVAPERDPDRHLSAD